MYFDFTPVKVTILKCDIFSSFAQKIDFGYLLCSLMRWF